MEVFPLNANVCVFVSVCVCVFVSVCVCVCIHFDYKLTTRSHAYTFTLKCVMIFFLSQSKTLHCKFLSPHAAQTVAETQNISGKKHRQKRWKKKNPKQKKQKIKLLP